MRPSSSSRRGLAALSLLLALASVAGAQTSHNVSVTGTSFSPRNITIAVGDTINWVWGTGIHDVVSGTGGVGDGAFNSGGPHNAPHTFSVTFNQAFLNANPKTCNRYNYFCAVHFAFGMTGSVTVQIPASSQTRNGSGVNPTGFAEVSPAVIGGTWSVTVDIATPGAVASAVAVSPLPPIQVGTAFGELLINISQLAGPINVAAGTHNVPIPNDCNLMGTPLATQAATIKSGMIRLQNAIDVVLGA